MSTEKKHTPLPWNWNQVYRDVIEISGPHCAASISFDVRDTEECKANAELIVRAVNSHAALVAALQTLINLHEGIDHGGNGIEPSDWDQARAALALAEGKAEK